MACGGFVAPGGGAAVLVERMEVAGIWVDVAATEVEAVCDVGVLPPDPTVAVAPIKVDVASTIETAAICVCSCASVDCTSAPPPEAMAVCASES